MSIIVIDGVERHLIAPGSMALTMQIVTHSDPEAPPGQRSRGGWAALGVCLLAGGYQLPTTPAKCGHDELAFGGKVLDHLIEKRVDIRAINEAATEAYGVLWASIPDWAIPEPVEDGDKPASVADQVTDTAKNSPDAAG